MTLRTPQGIQSRDLHSLLLAAAQPMEERQGLSVWLSFCLTYECLELEQGWVRSKPGVAG